MSSSIKKKPLLWLERTGRVLWETPLSLQRVTMVVLSLLSIFLIVAMVIFRYFLFISFMWVEELILFFVFWFYIAGAAYATYKRGHIVGGVVHLLFKDNPRVLGSFKVAAAAICLGLSGLMITLAYSQFTYSLTVNPKTIHWLLPLAYARLALLVGFPLIALYFLTDLIDSIRGLVRGESLNSAPRSGP